MEKIISNTGLQHLSEKVFWNLDVDNLKICSQINQPCKQMLENPIFWLKKFRSLSKKNQKDFIRVALGKGLEEAFQTITLWRKELIQDSVKSLLLQY